MHLNVGKKTYAIRVFSKPIKNFTTENADGFCDRRARVIYLSAAVAIDRRREVLKHEALHAFAGSFPRPAGEEKLATWTASMWESVEHDIQSQGGWKAIEALQPFDVDPDPAPVDGEPTPVELSYEPIEDEKPTPGGDFDLFPKISIDRESDLADWKARAEDGMMIASSSRTLAAPPCNPADVRDCAACFTRVNGSAIVNVTPPTIGEFGGQIQRALYCPLCGHVQTWLEGTTQSGKPGGVALKPPVFVSDSEKVMEFLRRHPQARPLEN